MSCKEWQDKIPAVDKVMAIICLLINALFWPGLGTMILAFMNKGGMEQCTLIIGIIQWLTCPLLIGWIWAIWWGFLAFQKAS